MSLSPDDFAHLDVLEGELQAARDELEKLAAPVRLAETRLALFRGLLASRCDHPQRFHREFSWEWDSGYGSQKMKQGIRCTLCGRENHWPGMSQNWTKP